MKKKFTAEQIEASAWAAALQAELVTDQVPPGWRTATELSEKLGKPTSTMGKLLTSAIRAGKCQRKNYRIDCGGFVRSVPHYRLLK